MWIKFSDFTPVQVCGVYWMRTPTTPKETAYVVELYRNYRNGSDWLVKSPNFYRPRKPKPNWLFWNEPLQPPHPTTLPNEPSNLDALEASYISGNFTIGSVPDTVLKLIAELRETQRKLHLYKQLADEDPIGSRIRNY